MSSDTEFDVPEPTDSEIQNALKEVEEIKNHPLAQEISELLADKFDGTGKAYKAILVSFSECIAEIIGQSDHFSREEKLTLRVNALHTLSAITLERIEREEYLNSIDSDAD